MLLLTTPHLHSFKCHGLQRGVLMAPATTQVVNTGAANGSFQVSDADSLLGLHQAYFTLKNFAGIP